MFGNVVSLRDYVDALREADLRANDIALDELKARLRILNELRGNVLTRDEFLPTLAALETEIGVLRDRVNRAEGKGSGLNAAWLILVAVLTLLIGAAAVIISLVR